MLNGTELMIQHYGSFSNYDIAVLRSSYVFAIEFKGEGL